MMASGKPVLVAEHISRSFGAVAALRDASISIEEGQILGLVGDNGGACTARATAGGRIS
jgi:ABC-type sugar transport system ATPase subunit